VLGELQRVEQRLLPQQARSEQTQGAGEVPGRLGSAGNRRGPGAGCACAERGRGDDVEGEVAGGGDGSASCRLGNAASVCCQRRLRRSTLRADPPRKPYFLLRL